MLILASISGIQDFLFDVRESGGKQARSLRFRSFRIQLLAEAVALRLLDAAGLAPDRVLFSAAAKVCIDAGDLADEALSHVRQAAADIEKRLLSETHGRLRLSVAFGDGGDGFAAVFDRAGRALARRKAQPYHDVATADGTTWPDGCLAIAAPWDADQEARRDDRIGSQLTTARFLSIRRDGTSSASQAVALVGLPATFDRELPNRTGDLLSVSNLASPNEQPPGLSPAVFHPRRLARYVPRDQRGEQIEFLDLAARARGAPMLGVLKADVDSLGQAIGRTLAHQADGARALRDLSESLDRFFSETLQAEMRKEPWNLIYTVFAGGDDMLLVGPWNVILDFAGHARRLFNVHFGPGATQSPSALPLTFSAGIAIIKPKYPIHLAAQRADGLLDAAKRQVAAGADSPKNQCAAFGGLWKWTDHDRVIGDGRQLADWAEAGVIQRGWLHTLLELALLRRGQAGPEYAGVHRATATSRLAYHVERNWPKNHEAREWIDAVLRDFDADPSQARGRAVHLPAIIRYAMLGTRGADSGGHP